MSEPFIGEIQIYAFGFAPKGWAFCNGQSLPIAQNTALFSLLGTTYGGNGQTTFNLPDFKGRVPIHVGQGGGLSSYTQGQFGGVENLTLLTTQIPAHSHNHLVSSSAGAVPVPANNALGSLSDNVYATQNNGAILPSNAVGNAGGSQPHSNMQPYLALNFCIATQGIYPSRN